MRLEDYRFYAKLCLGFGIFFIIIGIVLPIVTAYQVRYLWGIFPPEWRFPYLAHGIVLFSIGIALILANVILSREYRIRKQKAEVAKPVSVSINKCPQCGMKFSVEYEYCPTCGVKLESA